jgi:hypothetical protein
MSPGPLALLAPSAGGDTARTEGALEVSPECVLLHAGSDVTLLLWPSDRTRWDGITRSITLTNRDGSDVTVRDGTAMVVGGSGDSLAEMGLTAEAWLARMPWVVRPHPSCRVEAYWVADDVRLSLPPASPAAISLRVAPADLGCDAMGVPYRSVTFMIDPKAREQVIARADDGRSLRTFWSAGFAGGSAEDPVIRDPAGAIVVRDGDVLDIPLDSWPRLAGYFVCPSTSALYVLLEDPR